MELGVPKVGQNRNQVVSGKGDLTGKMAMFGGFVRNVAQKIQKTSMDVFKILLQDQSDTSHAVSQLAFFSKIYKASRCGCQIAIFAAKNGEQIFISEIYVCRFHL